MNKKRIYLASPFFNDHEIECVSKAETILRDKGLDVWSPREHEDREHEVGTRSWSETIFAMDKENIDSADMMVMLYHGAYSDSGTVWECGYAFAKGIPCVVVHLNNDSNLMVHEGSFTNLKGLDALKAFDFENPTVIPYEGDML